MLVFEVLVTLFKARLWKEFCLAVSKCCWREMLSICLCSPPLETWFPVSNCERRFVEQHARGPHASCARRFRANLIINSRGQRSFSTLFMLVWLTRAFFRYKLHLMLISVIFLSYLRFFVTRSCNQTRPNSWRPEGNRFGSLETKWEESVHSYNIFKVFCACYTQCKLRTDSCKVPLVFLKEQSWVQAVEQTEEAKLTPKLWKVR